MSSTDVGTGNQNMREISRVPSAITAQSQDETYPSWSPDGSRLAYQGDLDGSAIYVINADGSDDHAILVDTVFSVEPRWQP